VKKGPTTNELAFVRTSAWIGSRRTVRHSAPQQSYFVRHWQSLGRQASMVRTSAPTAMPRQPFHSDDSLQALPITAVRSLWHQTFKSTPPTCARKEFLIRILAHAMQGRAYKALSKSCAKALQELAQIEVSTHSDAAIDTKLKPGARLVRRWGGANHEVMVMDRGFAYRGSAYTSLTEVARRITGAHWSGPRFFGLQRTSKKMANGDGT
jgi:hypothetical protein